MIQNLDAAHFWSVETIDKLAEKVDDLEKVVNDLKFQVAALSKSSVPNSAPITKLLGVSKSTPSTVGRTLPLSQVGDITGTKPTMLCLPDGTQKSVSAWSAVLSECCLYCLHNNPHLVIPFLDKSAVSVYLLDFAKPGAKVSFFETIYQGKPLYVWLNYSALRCVKNALHALAQVNGAKGGEATVTFS